MTMLTSCEMTLKPRLKRSWSNLSRSMYWLPNKNKVKLQFWQGRYHISYQEGRDMRSWGEREVSQVKLMWVQVVVMRWFDCCDKSNTILVSCPYVYVIIFTFYPQAGREYEVPGRSDWQISKLQSWSSPGNLLRWTRNPLCQSKKDILLFILYNT